MKLTGSPATDALSWVEVVPGAERPPLDADLAGWTIHKQRPSHTNASRAHQGREYHLKWYARSVVGGNPARREFRSARRVSALGVPSVVPVGWGRHRAGTFFVMEGSPGTPVYDLRHPLSPEKMRRMARELGRLVALLHNADLCHRDLYVDHVLVAEEGIRIIDLGRVRRFRSRRWIVKDLGGLLFSAWRERLSSSLARAFFRSYLEHSRRSWNRKRLLRALQEKARSYWRHNRSPGPTGRSG